MATNLKSKSKRTPNHTSSSPTVNQQQQKQPADSSAAIKINFKNRPERETFKEQLKTLSNSKIDPFLSKDDIRNYLLACVELQKCEQDPVEINVFIQFLFKSRKYRILLANIFLSLEKCSALKFKILSQWMENPLELQSLQKEHFIAFLNLLKARKHLPQRFDPLGKNNFEVMLCAWIIHLVEEQEIQKEALSSLAYVTFLLGASLKLPEKEFSEEMMIALSQYIPIAHKLGYCDRKGYFETQKIDAGKSIQKAIIHPKVDAVSNFYKTLFLLQSLNLEILPNLLNRLEKIGSLKGFETDLKEYYEHVVRIFIPNLFTILHHPNVRAKFNIVQQLSKFLLEFPVAWYPQIEKFVIELTHNCLKHIQNLTLLEIFELLKLHEFIELRNKIPLLSSTDKENLIDHLMFFKSSLELPQIEMLMHMRFTLFFEFQEKFGPLLPEFKKILDKNRKQFKEHAERFYCERELYTFIHGKLSPENRPFIQCNFICEDTGREIDIVFIKDKLKVAIHVDGRAYHYYLTRLQENRTTLVRNQALVNAGWMNVTQMIPLKVTKKLPVEKQSLLDKLKYLLPLTGKEYTSYYAPEKIPKPLTYALSNSISSDIFMGQITQLLPNWHPDVLDEGIQRGLKNRFIKLQELLSNISGFHKEYTENIAHYELPHPESAEFLSIVDGPQKMRKFLNQTFSLNTEKLTLSKTSLDKKIKADTKSKLAIIDSAGVPAMLVPPCILISDSEMKAKHETGAEHTIEKKDPRNANALKKQTLKAVQWRPKPTLKPTKPDPRLRG